MATFDTQTLPEAEFYAKYQPQRTEHGDLKLYSRHNDEDRPLIQQALDERRLWTMHHGEYNSVYFWSGFHFVNTLDYVICAVPYDEGEDFITEDPDHEINTECPSCGAWHENLTEAQYDDINAGKPCGADDCAGDPDYEADEED